MSELKVTIIREDSFSDDVGQFQKEHEHGDIEEFMKEEGEYLDRLCGVLLANGEVGEEFTVTYKVNVIIK